MSEYWSSIEELYRVHIDQVLFEAHSYNYQLPEEELRNYHIELLKTLKTIETNSDSFDEIKKNIKSIFDTEIKRKNDAKTSLKRLTFAKDKCQSNDQKFHAFVKGLILNILIDANDKYSAKSPIPGLGIETTLFNDFFERHGVTYEDLSHLNKKIPARSFQDVFDSKIQIQHGKRSIVDEVFHTTDDLKELFLEEIEAELFVNAPEIVKPIDVNFITDQSLVQVSPNKIIEIPMLVLSKDQSTFEAVCDASIHYNVTISIDQKEDKIIKSFRSSSFRIKILALGSLFDIPDDNFSNSDIRVRGPLPMVRPDSIRKSKSLEESSEVNTQLEVVFD